MTACLRGGWCRAWSTPADEFALRQPPACRLAPVADTRATPVPRQVNRNRRSRRQGRLADKKVNWSPHSLPAVPLQLLAGRRWCSCGRARPALSRVGAEFRLPRPNSRFSVQIREFRPPGSPVQRVSGVSGYSATLGIAGIRGLGAGRLFSTSWSLSRGMEPVVRAPRRSASGRSRRRFWPGCSCSTSMTPWKPSCAGFQERSARKGHAIPRLRVPCRRQEGLRVRLQADLRLVPGEGIRQRHKKDPE